MRSILISLMVGSAVLVIGALLVRELTEVLTSYSCVDQPLGNIETDLSYLITVKCMPS